MITAGQQDTGVQVYLSMRDYSVLYGTQVNQSGKMLTKNARKHMQIMRDVVYDYC